MHQNVSFVYEAKYLFLQRSTEHTLSTRTTLHSCQSLHSNRYICTYIINDHALNIYTCNTCTVSRKLYIFPEVSPQFPIRKIAKPLESDKYG